MRFSRACLTRHHDHPVAPRTWCIDTGLYRPAHTACYLVEDQGLEKKVVAALETLAIIAYRQPALRVEMESRSNRWMDEKSCSVPRRSITCWNRPPDWKITVQGPCRLVDTVNGAHVGTVTEPGCTLQCRLDDQRAQRHAGNDPIAGRKSEALGTDAKRIFADQQSGCPQPIIQAAVL